MDKFIIYGGNRLKGQVRVSGSKNAALPVLCSAILSDGVCTFTNVPELDDIETICRVLGHLGITCSRPEKNTVVLDPTRISSHEAPYDLVKKMRASILVLGPLLARYGKAKVSLPGGCAIGVRPIDMHLNSLRKMGAEIDDLYKGILHCRVTRFQGTEILLDYPSVGATENTMLAACLAQGETVIRNAAKEPEIVDLQNFLQQMGVEIDGAGTGVIHITGRDEIRADVTYSVIPDRIVAGTYMACVAATGGVRDEPHRSLPVHLRHPGPPRDTAGVGPVVRHHRSLDVPLLRLRRERQRSDGPLRHRPGGLPAGGLRSGNRDQLFRLSRRLYAVVYDKQV